MVRILFLSILLLFGSVSTQGEEIRLVGNADQVLEMTRPELLKLVIELKEQNIALKEELKQVYSDQVKYISEKDNVIREHMQTLSENIKCNEKSLDLTNRIKKINNETIDKNRELEKLRKERAEYIEMLARPWKMRKIEFTGQAGIGFNPFLPNVFEVVLNADFRFNVLNNFYVFGVGDFHINEKLFKLDKNNIDLSFSGGVGFRLHSDF